MCQTEEANFFVEKMAEDEDLENILYCSRTPLDGMGAVLSEALITNDGLEDTNRYKRYVSIRCHHTCQFLDIFLN